MVHAANLQNDPIEAFITHWQGREGGQERANYQLFLAGLCRALDLLEPEPADASHERNDYVFERVVRRQRDEGEGIGRIDLYRRDCFVLEAKQSRLKPEKRGLASPEELRKAAADEPRGRRSAGRAWDVLMLNAKKQAEDYAKALPTSHGWPPFLLVCDVGHCIEVYADFSGQGKNYTQFPDRQGFRLYLEDLRKPEIRDRLRRIWLEPHALDVTKIAAKATREIAERLAAVSKSLEAENHPAEDVALFLMRCLFTMFAEDVGLLPEKSFSSLLDMCRTDAGKFLPLLEDLWHTMNGGGFAASIREPVKRFNGNLFADARALPLAREDIGELASAAQKNWREVEPAIFGTLLEQALDPKERKRLGAHYTPRAYVERLVIATVIEPLREDWRDVQSAAETLRAGGDTRRAAAEVQRFHTKLCTTRVLDPACGTGNFLYVALELMKRLEGEVLEALVDLGGQEMLTGLDQHTIDPHQFLGMELNPRAAAIAELVLWIGYLQWHFRTKGGLPSEPILKAFRNIQAKNAVLTWDGYPVAPIIDGRETYPNPRRPEWPQAEFVVGNPPFIGGKDLRARLGDASAEALWSAHRHINESADFVMYWWDRAAELLTVKGTTLRRFGLVTTNSITQEFSRRVMKKRMEAKTPVSLLMAIPDHPWTKATKDAAAVRIAMTVVAKGEVEGVLHTAVREEGLNTDEPVLHFVQHTGRINSDLTNGVDVTLVDSIRSNGEICSPGVKLHGAGFIVRPREAQSLGLDKRVGLDQHIRKYLNGRDIAGASRGAMVIDLYPLTSDEVRERYPEVYQHVLINVKPSRDKNNMPFRRRQWWWFGATHEMYRSFIKDLSRYVVTPETSKHRWFTFLDSDVRADNMLVSVGSEDAFHLGILSSQVHLTWTLVLGGTLEDRPRYTKSRCFDPFPFPDPSAPLKAEIRAVAEELDAFRKQRQAEHPKLTLTQMYNVLEKLRAIEPAAHSPSSHFPSSPGLARGPTPIKAASEDRAAITLTDDEERIKHEGLILILKELHERLDRLVFQAYGWPDTLSDQDILTRLVALNRERAEEEKRGHVRWLRPDYQIPRFGRASDKQANTEEGAQISAMLHVIETKQKPSFPASGFEQSAAVFASLAATTGVLDSERIAMQFKQGKRIEAKVAAVLASLVRLGHIATGDGGRTFSLRQVA